MYRLRTVCMAPCMTLLGFLFVAALPGPASAQSNAPAGIWSYRLEEATKPIEIAAKRKRARLPACTLNAAATKACSCAVTGGSPQTCQPGEVCSTAGCGG